MKSNKEFIVLTIVINKEEDTYTAECLELGTAAFGETEKEARDAVEDLITLQLSTLEEVGERDRFFEEHEIEIFPDAPTSTQIKNEVPLGVRILPEVREIAPI